MMRWTKKKPSEPGYYWRRGRLARIPTLVYVAWASKEWWVFQLTRTELRLSDNGWDYQEWAGPIPEPR